VSLLLCHDHSSHRDSLTPAETVLFNVIVIQWVISPDSSSPGSSKDDSQHLGTQHDDPDSMPTSGRRLGSIRHVSVDQIPHYTVDGTHDTGSSRRDLSSEAMIDRSRTKDDSGSMDTLPSVKTTLSLRKELGGQDTTDGGDDCVAVPEEVRVRGGNLHLSRIWRAAP
jgi:hypothetical protein